MIPLYLSIQGTCPSTSASPTAVTFSAADPLVIAGDARVDEDEIRRAIAYALYGCSGCAEQQLPDADSPCMHVSFVFWVHGAWEVTRTLMRLPNGAVDERHCVLRRVGDVSPPDRAIQGLRQVNDRLVELLQSDVETVQRRPRLRTRRPLAEPRRNVGDAHVATGGDHATLRDCVETLGRESVALRKDTAAVADATAAAAVAAARHGQAWAALIEHTEALRETQARHAAALERLQSVRARYGREYVGQGPTP